VVGAATGKEPDTVLAQDPAGESSAPKGSPVSLTVDPGVVVPDLVTPQFDGIAGIKTLQSAGLDIGTIGSACRGTVDKIIEQSIEAKTKVAKGTKVNIVLGAPVGVRQRPQSCRLIIRPEILTFANQSQVGGGPARPQPDPVKAFREANDGGLLKLSRERKDRTYAEFRDSGRTDDRRPQEGGRVPQGKRRLRRHQQDRGGPDRAFQRPGPG
jgi:hypothetical protein